MPEISKMQIDLMVNAFAADMNRVATLQYTNSVGQAKMKWLGIDEGHHELSHEPDSNTKAQEKLTKINKWFAEQVAYLAKRLRETPEPGGPGTMLDNTTIVWTNELGQGNSHTMNNIPFVLVGGGLGFKTGRALDYKRVAHNRLLMAPRPRVRPPRPALRQPRLLQGRRADGLGVGCDHFVKPPATASRSPPIRSVGLLAPTRSLPCPSVYRFSCSPSARSPAARNLAPGGGSASGQAGKGPVTPEVADLKDAKPDYTFTAEDWHTEFKKDEAAATAKYMDKVIGVGRHHFCCG